MDRHFVAVCTEREVKVSYVTICTQMRKSTLLFFVVTFASLIDYITCTCQLCKTGDFCIKASSHEPTFSYLASVGECRAPVGKFKFQKKKS